MIRAIRFLPATLAMLGIFSVSVDAAEVTGAGASFVYPAMSRWSADYNAATGNQVNYQSIGSGGGIAQIKSATVDFGSSDAPLKPEELDAAGLAQFPSVMGAVVPVVNIPGVTPGALRVSGELLADIFLGKVKQWNDAAIVALNPDLALPPLRITVVHRSDGSGTTFNWVNYLSKVSAEWKSAVGEGTAVRWPTGLGGKGNEGVATYTKQIKGAIGYVELSYALSNKLTYTQVKNAAGHFITPSVESVAAAGKSADWAGAQDFSLVISNAPGADAYPIAATNFILLHKQAKDAAQSKAVLDYFRWVYAHGDEAAIKLGYVALPDELVTQIETYWTAELKF